MNTDQLKRMQQDKGFIAALDQSGGSTPKALAAYGVDDTSYSNETEMFDLVHAMRTRIMVSPSFTGEHIIGAILFKETMERRVLDRDTADYLWEEKGIVPFLKIDAGLREENEGVQLMKPIPDLDTLLMRATKKSIFGTKMRSVVNELNKNGIDRLVEQQFDVARQVIEAGLVPIIEPEVNIHASEKAQIEKYLKVSLLRRLDGLSEEQTVMLKLTLPETANLYKEFVEHPRVLLVVALSGGYSRSEANERLAKQDGVVASFSRALASDLSASQSQEEFNSALMVAVESIYRASIANGIADEA